MSEFGNVNFKAVGDAAVQRETNTTRDNPQPSQPAPAATPAPPAVAPVGNEPPAVAAPPVIAQPPAQPGQAPVVPGTVPPAVATPPPTGEPTYDVDLGNGRIEKLTATQMREAYLNGLRQQDYTKKTTEVANQRREIEAAAQQLAQYREKVQFAEQLIGNPQTALQWAQSQLQQQLPQLPPDPTAPLTVAQAQQMMTAMNSRIAQAEQLAQAEVAKARQFGQQYVEDKMAVADYGAAIHQTLENIYKDNPVLKLDPNFEDMLRYRVGLREPQNIEETLQAFQEVGKEFASNLDKFYQSRFSQNQAQTQQLANTGIELPGGTPPPVPKPSFVNAGKLDWNRLKNATKDQYKG